MEPKPKTSKAFIGYVVVALIIIASTTALMLNKKGDNSIHLPNQNSTSTDNSLPDTNTSSTNPGPNDMNGSGQNEPEQPIQSTGFQSPISIPLYQHHIVGGQSISSQVMIYPWSVLEDSRCPIDVQCIQAGRVRVGIYLQNPETKANLIEGQTLEVGQKIKVNGLEIVLLEVKPYTKSTIKIKDSDYRFIFGITKVR